MSPSASNKSFRIQCRFSALLQKAIFHSCVIIPLTELYWGRREGFKPRSPWDMEFISYCAWEMLAGLAMAAQPLPHTWSTGRECTFGSLSHSPRRQFFYQHRKTPGRQSHSGLWWQRPREVMVKWVEPGSPLLPPLLAVKSVLGEFLQLSELQILLFICICIILSFS